MLKLDLVLQGSIRPETYEIIQQFSELEFVNKIILSSYKTSDIPRNVVFVDNDVIDPPGVGNRNLQINTTINGLKKVDTEFCVKLRTDQIIPKHSMYLMYDYWLNNDDPLNRKKEKNKPLGRLYVCGLYRNFPYHPRDHVFWGFTEDIVRLFEVPFDFKTDPDYTRNVRAETYIGQYYYAKYNPKIYNHILHYDEYLVDGAPKHNEAMSTDWVLRDELFKVFPRIEFAWPKHFLTNYHYHVGEQCSEYWAD